MNQIIYILPIVVFIVLWRSSCLLFLSHSSLWIIEGRITRNKQFLSSIPEVGWWWSIWRRLSRLRVWRVLVRWIWTSLWVCLEFCVEMPPISLNSSLKIVVEVFYWIWVRVYVMKCMWWIVFPQWFLYWRDDCGGGWSCPRKCIPCRGMK